MSPVLLLLLAPALAAPATVDPSRYPQRVEVAVPEGRAAEVLRIPVPLDLRSAADPADGSDLALLAADGRPLAMALARGEGEARTTPLAVRPTDQGDTWTVEVLDRPADALQVDLRGGQWAARVAVSRWDGAAWQPLVPPTLLWELDHARYTELDLPPTQGPLRLSITRLYDPRGYPPSVDAVLRAEPHVDPVELRLPVAHAALEENGWARYTVELGRPLPVRAVRIEAEEEVFERAVEVAMVGELDEWHSPSAEASIRRVRLGGAALDEVRVPVDEAPADLLVFWIECQGQLPLTVPQVTVELEGAELLVPAPGPGPLTLLGGAEPGTTPTGDLDLALPELSRLARFHATPGAVSANPAWTPPEIRADLAVPSTVIDPAGMRWSHPVEGPAGLVRIPLPAEVLADARADRGDLRLLDSEGRQVPYLLRRRPLDRDLGALTFTRSEEGAQSILRVPLPTAGAMEDGPPLSTVRISTDAPLFSRTVTLSRVRGPVLEPLRVYHWAGQDRPATLSLDLGVPVGDELVITIHNGDDPPLPVRAVQASVQHWELVTVLPEGGARLLYGDPERETPDYDLALLRQDLVSRAAVEATLGAREAVDGPQASAVEKGLVLAGLLALVAGLGALVVGLVRAVPEEEGEEPPGEAAGGDGAGPGAG